MSWPEALAAVKAGKLKQSQAARELGVKRQHFHAVYHGQKPIPKKRLGPRKPKESPPMVEPKPEPKPDVALAGPKPAPAPTWGGAPPDTLDDVLRGPSDPNNPKPSLSPSEPTRTVPPGASAPAPSPTPTSTSTSTDAEPEEGEIDLEAAKAGTDFLLMLRTGILKTMLYYHGIDATDPRVQALMPESDARDIRRGGSTLEFVLKQNPRFTQSVGKHARGWKGIVAGVIAETWRIKNLVGSLAAQMGDEEPEPPPPPAPAPAPAAQVSETLTTAPPNETPSFDLGAAIRKTAKESGA